MENKALVQVRTEDTGLDEKILFGTIHAEGVLSADVNFNFPEIIYVPVEKMPEE